MNGIQILSKGCQITSQTGTRCCTSNFCNNAIIQPPEVTTTVRPMTNVPCDNTYGGCNTNPAVTSFLTTTKKSSASGIIPNRIFYATAISLLIIKLY
jgi:hypothetical protein